MDTVAESRVWVVGQGFIMDIGLLPDDEVEKIKNLSIEQRNEYLTKIMSQYPDAFKITAGYCQEYKNHVHERECLHCARNVKKYELLAQWESCRQTNLSR